MSEADKYLELIKDQNRAIATLRKMMERGYFIVYLADKSQFGINQRTGRWALCKCSVPKDKDEGIVLFDLYDDAYEKAQHLIWIDHDLKKNCDKVYHLKELNSLVRKIIVKE